MRILAVLVILLAALALAAHFLVPVPDGDGVTWDNPEWGR